MPAAFARTGACEPIVKLLGAILPSGPWTRVPRRYIRGGAEGLPVFLDRRVVSCTRIMQALSKSDSITVLVRQKGSVSCVDDVQRG